MARHYLDETWPSRILSTISLPGRAERNSYGTGSTAIVSPCQMTKIYNLTAQLSRLWIDVSAASSADTSWTKEKLRLVSLIPDILFIFFFYFFRDLLLLHLQLLDSFVDILSYRSLGTGFALH